MFGFFAEQKSEHTNRFLAHLNSFCSEFHVRIITQEIAENIFNFNIHCRIKIILATMW
jgi:hypothetical protein